VSANTAASGNTSVYGSSHKAVFITDAAPLSGLDGLASAPGGATADNPVSLALSGSLTNDSWAFTLTTIAGVGKYVSLDLSACTMTGTEFVPGTNNAGANRVTALVLPNAAKGIPAGTSSSAPFSAFTALASLSGVGVETIGDNAFYGYTSLTTVSLPAATDIGDYAFYGCTYLTSVSLPAATDIGNHAFNGCTRLTSVSLPAAQTVGTQAFYGCTNLTTVSLPAATDIGASAFNGCTSLTTVSLPAATNIGNYAFGVGASLATVSLPATPPAISSIFFYTGSSGTITVRVPAGAVSAYTSAWGVDATTPAGGNTGVYGASHKAVFITNAAPLTGLDGLADAPGGNTADNPVSLALSGSLTTDSWAITLAVIAGAGKYVSLDLSACTMDETEFVPGTGAGANKVTALVLPNAAKSLPAGTSSSGAFSAFTTLRSLSGAGVETIGTYAFNGCTNLVMVSLPATPPAIGSGIFYATASSDTIIVRVPTGAVSAYTSAWGVSADTAAGGNTSTYGSNHKAVIITDAAPLTGLDGLANAPGGATADNPVSLALSGSFTNDRWALTLAVIAEVGKYVSLDLSACTMTETEFVPRTDAGANRVTALVLPDAAKSIPAGTSVSSGYSYTYYATFRAFTALTSLSGAGVKTIGDYTFYGCDSLASVSLPKAQTIGDEAFSGCTSLTSVSLPAATSIGYDAFWSCDNLATVSLPAAQTIDASAFQVCTSLTSVSLPVVTSIGNGAFWGCDNLATVSLPATPPDIGNHMFTNTGSSGTITIRVPAGVVFAYTSEWGVSVNTSAGSSYSSVYGDYHKAVLITDAAQ
jgi:hypothetical protein